MEIGVVFPQTEIGSDPAVIRDFAQTAEGLGFAHILAYDHVLGAVHAGREPALVGPYTEHTLFHEPLTLFAWMAGMTSRIGFFTGVLIVTQRQTALVAKQAAEVAILSDNRLRLGIGTGWNYVEYESLGVPFGNRGRREEEQVEVLRRLWTEPVVVFSGRFHRIDRAGILPRPEHSVPIWFGGYSERVLDRAARIGDGFVFSRLSSLAVDTIPRMRERAAAAGRDPATLGFEAVTAFSAGQGSWAADVQRWQDAGGTHCSVNTMGAGLEGPRDHLAALSRYAEQVLPAATS